MDSSEYILRECKRDRRKARTQAVDSSFRCTSVVANVFLQAVRAFAPTTLNEERKESECKRQKAKFDLRDESLKTDLTSPEFVFDVVYLRERAGFSAIAMQLSLVSA